MAYICTYTHGMEKSYLHIYDYDLKILNQS